MSQSRASSLRSSPSATLDSLIRRSCASNCEPNVFAFGSPSTPLARATSIHDGGTHCGLHAQIVFRVWSTFREQKWVTFGECRGACDGLDGVKDAVLEDPMRCHFDPKVLQCSGADTAACLTAPQVEAARVIYGPAKTPRTGAEIFPGWNPAAKWAGPLWPLDRPR